MAASRRVSRKKITRALISIIFVVYGIESLIPAVQALAYFEIGEALLLALSSAVAILMLLTGLFGLFGASIKVVRALAVIVCVLCAAKFVLSIVGGAFPLELLVQALLAWIYFDC